MLAEKNENRIKKKSVYKFYEELKVLNSTKKVKKQRYALNRSQKQNKSTKLPSIFKKEDQDAQSNISRDKNVWKKVQAYQKRIHKIQNYRITQEKISQRMKQYFGEESKHNSSNRQPSLYLISCKNYQSHGDSLMTLEQHSNEFYHYNQPFQIPNRDQMLYDRKPKIKKSMSRKFRVVALAVLFTILFPKYSRTVTILKYEKFMREWRDKRMIIDEKKKLFKSIRKQIKQKIFMEDSFGSHEFNEKYKRQQKNNNDSQSNKNNGQNKQIIEFYIRFDDLYSFLADFIKKITQFIDAKKFEVFFPLLSQCLPMQFVPSHIFDSSDISIMNFNKVKGYNQYNEEACKYVLCKQLFYECIIQTNLINLLGTQYSMQKYGQYNIEGSLLSLFVRSKIFEKICLKYIKKLYEKLKKYDIPSKIPCPQYKDISVLYGSQQNQMIDLKLNIGLFDGNSISRQQMKQFVKLIVPQISGTLERLYDRLKRYSNKTVKQLKQRALSEKWRWESDDFFTRQQ